MKKLILVLVFILVILYPVFADEAHDYEHLEAKDVFVQLDANNSFDNSDYITGVIVDVWRSSIIVEDDDSNLYFIRFDSIVFIKFNRE
ncbi:MAG: hypothetical protein ACLFSL_05040 [Candidatus Woesearchaeota archaeon]